MLKRLISDAKRCRTLLLSALFASACSTQQPGAVTTESPYLFVWAGPHGAQHTADHTAEHNFVAVIDADSASNTYGKILASVDAGAAGAMAHHTELSMPAGHALFASDFLTG